MSTKEEPSFDPTKDEWGHWGKGEIGELTYKLARARGLISAVMCSEHAADLGDPEPDFPDTSEMQAILDETAHKSRVVADTSVPAGDFDRAEYIARGLLPAERLSRALRVIQEIRMEFTPSLRELAELIEQAKQQAKR